jgi:hypothetical protein
MCLHSLSQPHDREVADSARVKNETLEGLDVKEKSFINKF